MPCRRRVYRSTIISSSFRVNTTYLPAVHTTVLIFLERCGSDPAGCGRPLECSLPSTSKIPRYCPNDWSIRNAIHILPSPHECSRSTSTIHKNR
ncbi:hypothetical protein K402DRAFT_242678 [Aulographum hederae CBS 113979]|uniref:Uncharacterized protein n=1 Tax=Aulographum hederae CBS 113979 TaxID=1176131 RepID=A0A6G1H9J5_9PEZI|nr:hypothetical protein K402DRAFT_242678 [Aulographum hederae CBS 113979]